MLRRVPDAARFMAFGLSLDQTLLMHSYRGPVDFMLPVSRRAHVASCPGHETSQSSVAWATVRQTGRLAAAHAAPQARAPLNAVARDGTSALLCATRADASPLKVVELLLDGGADADARPAPVHPRQVRGRRVAREKRTHASTEGLNVQAPANQIVCCNPS